MKGALGTKKKTQAGVKIKVFYFLLIIFCLVMGCALFLMGQKSHEWKKHVIAHRGGGGEEIEHTFAAYDLAILYGVEYIEQDAVLSRDGTLWVSHDLSALRMTGADRDYADMTDEEIGMLDVLRTDEKIHSLQSVFDRYGETVHYVVELKENDAAVGAFLSLLGEYPKLAEDGGITVQAWTVTALESLKEADGRLRTLYLSADDSMEEALASEYVDIIALNGTYMDKRHIGEIRVAGKEACFWTINSTEDIKEAIRLGADSYFTDFPGKAILLEKKFFAVEKNENGKK